MRTLSRDETRSYLEHRCTIAGSTTLPFDDGATDAIFEIGRGNLHATDQLARKCLEVAHADVSGTIHVARARRLLWP